jgi:YVTN family beta-propeller protein
VINPETNLVYAANQTTNFQSGPGTIYVIDATTNTVVKSINQTSSEVQPMAMAIDIQRKKLYVINTGGVVNHGNVTVIDIDPGTIASPNPAYNTEIATVADSNGVNPSSVVFDTANDTLYVANSNSTNLSVFNFTGSSTSPAISDITLASSAATLALNPASHPPLLYAPCAGNGVVVINTSTNTIANTIAAVIYAAAIAVDTEAQIAYAAAGNAIYLISGSSYTGTTFNTGGSESSRSIAVNPYTHHVFVGGSGEGCGNGVVSVYKGGVGGGYVNSVCTPSGDGTVQAVAVDVNADIAYATQEGGAVSLISATAADIADITTTGGASDVVAVDPLTHKAYASAGTAISVIDGTTHKLDVNSPTATGSRPWAIAVNPVTNEIYVSNQSDNTVTAINGSDNSVDQTINVGISPQALAVDPVNNVVYVADQGAGGPGAITEIDGNTLTGLPVNLTPYGGGPMNVSPDSIAYNPIANYLYGGSSAASLVFDFQGGTAGGSDSAFGGAFGAGTPIATAVNPAAGMNYTLFQTGGSTPFLAVNDDVAPYGFYENVCFVDAGGGSHPSTPQVMDVNPVTNTVYIGCSDGNIDIVQGADGYGDGTRTTIANPNFPGGSSYGAMVVNPVTNHIFFGTDSSANGGFVADINGSNNNITFVSGLEGLTGGPMGLAINEASNRVYALYFPEPGPYLAVIDGATDEEVGHTKLNGLPVGPESPVVPEVAVNPVTNEIYALEQMGNQTENIDEVQPINFSCTPTSCLSLGVSGSTGFPSAHASDTTTQTFAFVAANSFDGAPVNGVFYQLDTMAGPWLSATNTGGNDFQGSLTNVTPGFHILYAYATDEEDATASNAFAGGGIQSSPLVGTVTTFTYLAEPPNALGGASPLNFGSQSQGTISSENNYTLANEGGYPLNYSYAITGPNSGDFQVDTSHFQSCQTSGTLSAQQYCQLWLYFLPTTFGPESATVTFTDNSLQSSEVGFTPVNQIVSLSGTGITPVPTFSEGPGNPSYITSGTIAFQDADGAATFQCSLVLSPAAPSYGPCTDSNDYLYSGLIEGDTYIFYVTATDAAEGGTSAPSTLTWTVTPSQVTVTFAGTGTGSVSASPAVSGFPCTASCSGAVNGIPVTLTATPTGSSTFAGWTDTSGADPNDQCPVVGNPLQCTLATGDSFKTATATFNAPTFGSVNVCQSPFTSPAPCSQTTIFNYVVPATDTYSGASALTLGASGLDFTVTDTTCSSLITAGNTCSINVTFKPTFPGLRLGAIQLTHASSTTPTTIFISAVGQGPAVGFTPSATSVILPSAGVNNPGQVAVDGAGNVYVASSRSSGSVLKIPAGGGPHTTVGTGLNFPYGVAVDGAGNVYISNSFSGTSTVVEVTPGGVQTTLPTTVFAPMGLALDAAGDLFIADSGNARVVELPANGSPQTTISTGSITLSNPAGMAFDAAGDLYIADGGNGNTPGSPQVVEVPANAGTPTVVNTGSYTLGQPYGVAVDAAGDLLIADFVSGGNGVVEVPASGSPFTVLGGHTGIIINTPITVAVDPSGNLYIPDYNEGTLTEFQLSQGPTLTYAATDVGQTSTDSPQTVLMQNTGNQVLHASGFGLTVSGSDFMQVPSSGTPPGCTSGFSLSEGASCMLPFSFKPTTGGPLSSNADVIDNALNATSASPATQTITLLGTGLAPQTLTVTGAGTGSGTITDSTTAINCTWNGSTTSGTCSASFSYDTVVNLTAAATGGSSFTTWGVDCSSFGATNPCSLTMTAPHSASATFTAPAPPPTSTLTVNLIGTGNGSVSDLDSNPPPQSGSISCSESEGVISGSCSDTYNTTQTALLSQTTGANSNFVAWTGCDSIDGNNRCVASMATSRTVSANFTPNPIAVPVTFPVSAVPVTQTAVYNCPSNTNPCTDPEASEVQLTLQNVNTSFTVNVTATEVPPNTADDICESNIDNTAASVAADFDCRFLQFFNYGTDTVSGGAIVPLCLPYSHGNCIHYEVSVGPNGAGGEPNAANYVGPVVWELTWNDDGVTPPASSYWTGSTPQVYDDPDYPVLPTAPYGTDCTTAMTNGTGYFCQFEYNITIPGSYDPSRPVDSGIGGTTRQFNDVVIAWPPTNVPTKTTLPLLNAASAPDNSQVAGGSGGGIGYTINLVNSGANTVSGIVLSDPLPSGTGMNWTLASAPAGFGCMINGANPSQTLTCNPLTVASGNQLSFHLTSPTPAAGQYTNVATFTIGTQQTFGVAVLTVSSASQTITFAPPASPQPYNASFLVSASSTSSLAVTITASGVCTINGGTSVTTSGTVLMTSGTGTCTLTASQAGNGSFNAATNVVRTVTASLATQTITFAQPTSPAAYNSSFAVSASSTSSLAVTITASGVCTINGGSSATTSGTVLMTSGTGTCTLTASQAGNTNYGIATNVVRTVTAAKASQTITFAQPTSPADYNSGFGVSASSTSSLAVTIAASGVCTINGGASATTSGTVLMTSGTGTCTLTASQAGNGNYSLATNVVRTVTAALASQTITLSNVPVSEPASTPFTVSATGGASGNPIVFTSSSDCTNSGATYTTGSSTGTCNVIANQAGTTGKYSAAPQVTQGVAVTAAVGGTLKFSPTSFNFGTINTGNTALATVTITNTGTKMVTFSSFKVASITGDDSTGFLGVELCPNTLNAGKSCVVIMSFTADSQTAKTHAANLVITDNGAGSPQTIPMTVAGVINPIATLSPTSLSFGNQKTNTTSAAKSITLKNTGTTPLIVSSISISGNFAITTGSNACPSSTTLSANASCNIYVNFKPTSKGSKSGSVSIKDNARNSPQSVSLSGSGN